MTRIMVPPGPGLLCALGELRTALRATRQVYFPELGGFVDCPIYDRELIPHGAGLELRRRAGDRRAARTWRTEA